MRAAQASSRTRSPSMFQGSTSEAAPANEALITRRIRRIWLASALAASKTRWSLQPPPRKVQI